MELSSKTTNGSKSSAAIHSTLTNANRFSTIALAVFWLTALNHQSARADQRLVGSWKIVAFYVQSVDTQERKNPLGPNPQGRIILTSDGYVTNFRVASGRKAGQSEAENAELLKTMAAWTGRYRVEGDTITINIQSSWNERVSNTESVRTFKIEGKRLTFSVNTSDSNFFPGRPAIGGEVFERDD